jgi:hypothetical protein
MYIKSCRIGQDIRNTLMSCVKARSMETKSRSDGRVAVTSTL